MAQDKILHLHNETGLASIEIGAKEFMCMGAKPPHDHPHIFLDMGRDNDIVCPYCATLYRYNAKLKPNEANHKTAVWEEA